MNVTIRRGSGQSDRCSIIRSRWSRILAQGGGPVIYTDPNDPINHPLPDGAEL
jgi:hypothetical protein